ncbi:hypothetical protein NDU88_005501 [Pleurodeles waltl]|uniref:Uncharacterized protein n=1 Tax=Pleurodeles waltl TaxID=8319 RepID=A0AAV7L7P0_PLEWA|nr:hypothetical protein NDU88_005501 [Pleurodeles waltl]
MRGALPGCRCSGIKALARGGASLRARHVVSLITLPSAWTRSPTSAPADNTRESVACQRVGRGVAAAFFYSRRAAGHRSS